MDAVRPAPASPDAYIAAAAPEVRAVLEAIRAEIRRGAPQAVEKISYGMPSFFQSGRVLVHYAAFKTHIGMFPPVRDPKIVAATERYRGEKGNLRFPLSEPMPMDLIGRIVAARLREVAEKVGMR